MVVTIKLLTSPRCPMCPKAKKVVEKLVEEEKDVVAIELPVNTEKGFKEALRFGIRAVPAIIINDKLVMIGVPTIDQLKEAVNRFKD